MNRLVAYTNSEALGRNTKNNRSKSACTLNARKPLNNQAVWPVIFGLTGPICARAPKSVHLLELCPRGHHDWPVKPAYLKMARLLSAKREVGRSSTHKLPVGRS